MDHGLKLKANLTGDVVWLAKLQRECASISATLGRMKQHREEEGYWDPEEADDFDSARDHLLDAADNIHQLAVGVLVKLKKGS